MNTEVCTTNLIHKEKVAIIQKNLINKDLSTLLVLGKCFADPSRIKIFYALETYKEMCVCDLAAVLDANLKNISPYAFF